jgi:hypothetical protein
MATEKQPIAIQLVRFWRGREIGSRIPVGAGGLTYGAAQIVVELHRHAEWVYDGDRGTPLGMEPPKPLPVKADVLPTPMAGAKQLTTGIKAKR